MCGAHIRSQRKKREREKKVEDERDRDTVTRLRRGKRRPEGGRGQKQRRDIGWKKRELRTRPTNVDELKSRTVQGKRLRKCARDGRNERASERERDRERKTRPIATTANFSAKARFAEEQAQREIVRLSSGRRWRYFFFSLSLSSSSYNEER